MFRVYSDLLLVRAISCQQCRLQNAIVNVWKDLIIMTTMSLISMSINFVCLSRFHIQMSQNCHLQRNGRNYKKYFSSSCPKDLKKITSEAPINFSKIIANPFSLDSNRIKNKARPENYTVVMATEFDTDLTSRDVISADVITEVNPADDVVMSSDEKRDTYDGVSDDFSQIVSSRGSNVPNADSNIGITCHDVLSSDVKYQSCSGGLKLKCVKTTTPAITCLVMSLLASFLTVW